MRIEVAEQQQTVRRKKPEHVREARRGGKVDREIEMQHHRVCSCEAVSSAALSPVVMKANVLWSCTAQIPCKGRRCR